MTQLHLCKSSSLQVQSSILSSTSHSSTMRQHQHYLQQQPSASAPHFGAICPSLFSLPGHPPYLPLLFPYHPQSLLGTAKFIHSHRCRALWLHLHGEIRVQLTHLHGTSTQKSRRAMPPGTCFDSRWEEGAHLRKWWILQTGFRVHSTSLSIHTTSEV